MTGSGRNIDIVVLATEENRKGEKVPFSSARTGGVVRHEHVFIADTVQGLSKLEHVDVTLVRPDLLEIVQATRAA